MPGGGEIALFTWSFDEGDVVPEFDGNFCFVWGRVGQGEVGGCLIHFPLACETVTSFMTSFVVVRAGYLIACSTSSSPSFAFGVGPFVRSRFPCGFVASISFALCFTFPFLSSFSFSRRVGFRLIRF